MLLWTALLDRRSPGHVRVDRADERVGAGRKRRHVVDLGRDPREDLALEGLLTGRRSLVERNVMGGALVLVREGDRERLAGRRRDGRLDERHALGMDLHVGRGTA